MMPVSQTQSKATEFLDSSLDLERESAAALGPVRDPVLSTVLADGRTLRQALLDVIDYYNEHTQQLIWTKWSHAIPRSETRALLGQLQAARANFIAYISDLADAQLTTLGTREGALDPAGHATGSEVVTLAQEEDRTTIGLIADALKSSK